MDQTWWVSEEQLKGEQRAIVTLPIEGSHLILGPPGSGKTNLLLLRANYLHLAGHTNLAIVVFTRTLQEFIVAGGHEYDFPHHKIKTSVQWQQHILRQYGVAPRQVEDFEEQRETLNNLIQDELLTKRGVSGIFDAILLDEAHDYTPAEVVMFRQLTKMLYAVADARQRIYRTTDPMDALKAAVDNVHVLEHHYRLGIKICEVADEIGNDAPDYHPLKPYSNYNEAATPSSVTVNSAPTIAEQAARAAETIQLQLKAYPNELIGLLSPTNNIVQNVWTAIQAANLPDCILHVPNDRPPFTPDTKVFVGTIHSAKGLEFRAVHIIGADDIRKLSLSRNSTYTAVTRAKTALAVYHSNPLEPYFEQALRTGETPAVPTLKDAFGRKGKR